MKMIATVVMAGALATTMALAEDGHAQHAAGEHGAKIVAQTTCPAMGGKINKEQYVDYEGKRIYVCCKGCIAKIQKDPKKYIQKMESEGVTVAKVQTTCAVMGGKIKKDLYVDHDGKRIYMCCKGCTGKLKADPGKYVAELEAAGIALDAVPKATGHEASSGGHAGHNH